MTTKEAIKKQFLELYKKEDFAKISVKELCASTPVARTTFYSYYNNTDDVRLEIENELIDGIMEITDTSKSGSLPEEEMLPLLTSIQNYIKGNWSRFCVLLVTQPSQRFINRWKTCIKLNFKNRYPEKQRINNYDLIAEMVASATVGAYAYWMQNPEKVSTEDIKKLICKALESLAAIL
ncbi:MAG: TetR/AcrR family transcriptional regulator [Eubacterium sp.]|nr:TetR/AcrR family transcriptional regulator [Eubacterium sp.]